MLHTTLYKTIYCKTLNFRDTKILRICDFCKFVDLYLVRYCIEEVPSSQPFLNAPNRTIIKEAMAI